MTAVDVGAGAERMAIPRTILSAVESSTLTMSLEPSPNMDYRVSYEHSLASAPNDYIVHVPSQLVDNVPANVPRALLPEFITELILKRSPQIGKIRYLRIL